MENRVVTCIMTVYKKYKYIYRAIDSILRQSYPEIELIICDDCSGDFPKQKIIDYVNMHKQENIKTLLVYSNEKNLGTVKNFNSAIKKARGYYFIGLSSDDIFYDAFVMENIVKKFDETKALYATCRAVMETKDWRNGLCFQTEKNIKNIIKMNTSELYNHIVKDNIILGASTYFTFEAIQKYGYFDEQYKYIEDLPRFLSIYRLEDSIAFFDVTAIWHTMDGISNKKIVPKRYLQDNMNICKNEILNYRERLSLLSYRYNLCRKKSLDYRIQNDGALLLKDKICLMILYPEAVLYNVFSAISKRFAKRSRAE